MGRLRFGMVAGFLLMAAWTARGELTDGLVLYLSFDEGAGKTATDQSPTNAKAEVKGAAWTDGQVGKALQFNGKDAYVEITYTDAFNITEAISIGAWLKANVPFSPEWREVLNARMTTYGPYLLQTGGAAKAEIGLYLGGAWTWLRTASSLEKDKFHHVVGVYDQKNGLHIYFDGKLDDDAGSPGAKPGPIDKSPKENLGVGHDYGLAGRYWDGTIDEVVLYNRALSDKEVAELFTHPPVFAVEPAGKLAMTWATVKSR